MCRPGRRGPSTRSAGARSCSPARRAPAPSSFAGAAATRSIASPTRRRRSISRPGSGSSAASSPPTLLLLVLCSEPYDPDDQLTDLAEFEAGSTGRREVPFLDLGAAYEELATELDDAYRAVMGSGRFLLGEQLAAFEEEFAAHSDAAHCAGVGSGFDALALGLRALGVEPGDEVLVPANGSAYHLAGGRLDRRRAGGGGAARSDPHIDPARLECGPRPAPGPSSRSTSTAARRTWPRSSAGRGSTGCGSWRTRPRPTGRGSTVPGSARSATPSPGASTRARTWAASPTAAP